VFGNKIEEEEEEEEEKRFPYHPTYFRRDVCDTCTYPLQIGL
jgi:hypothetical protein